MIYDTLIIVRSFDQAACLSRRVPATTMVIAYSAAATGNRFDTIIIAIDWYDPNFPWHRWFPEFVLTKRRTVDSMIVGMNQSAFDFAWDTLGTE